MARRAIPMRGVTLLEVMTSLALFSIMSGAFYAIAGLGLRAQSEQDSRSALLLDATSAISQIQSELQGSGVVTVSGNAFPAIYSPTLTPPTGYFASYDHAQPAHPSGLSTAVPSGAAASDEIVYKKVKDVDGNGYPLAGAGTAHPGDIEWGPEEFRLTIQADARGVNQLVKETWNPPGTLQSSVVLARYVERMRIVTSAYPTGGADATLSPNEISVSLYLARRVGADAKSAGNWIQVTPREAVILFRNSTTP